MGISNHLGQRRSPTAKSIGVLVRINPNRSHTFVLRPSILIVHFCLESCTVVIMPYNFEPGLAGLFVLSPIFHISSHIGRLRIPANEVVRAITYRRIFDDFRHIQFRHLGSVSEVTPSLFITNPIIKFNVVASFFTLCWINDRIFHVRLYSIASTGRTLPFCKLIVTFGSFLSRSPIRFFNDFVIVIPICIPNRAIFIQEGYHIGTLFVSKQSRIRHITCYISDSRLPTGKGVCVVLGRRSFGNLGHRNGSGRCTIFILARTEKRSVVIHELDDVLTGASLVSRRIFGILINCCNGRCPSVERECRFHRRLLSRSFASILGRFAFGVSLLQQDRTIFVTPSDYELVIFNIIRLVGRLFRHSYNFWSPTRKLEAFLGRCHRSILLHNGRSCFVFVASRSNNGLAVVTHKGHQILSGGLFVRGLVYHISRHRFQGPTLESIDRC